MHVARAAPMVGDEMATLDANTIADKWVQRAAAAAPEYLAGVEQTTKDPTALAAAAGARYLANVTAAYNSGAWARGLQRVGKAGWQQAVRDKGAQNFSVGVTAARDKFAARIAPVLVAVEAGQRLVAGMPNVTDAQRDARMLAFVNHMRQSKRTA